MEIKTMAELKTISPRITKRTREFLLSLGGTVNAGAEYSLEMLAGIATEHAPATFGNAITGIDYAVKAFSRLYRKALMDIIGTFEKNELLLMLDNMNGVMLTPAIAGQHIVHNVLDGIALDGLDKKWEIDADVLNEKLKCLSEMQLIALELWCRAYWEVAYHSDSSNIEDYVKQLTYPD